MWSVSFVGRLYFFGGSTVDRQQRTQQNRTRPDRNNAQCVWCTLSNIHFQNGHNQPLSTCASSMVYLARGW